MIFYIRVYIDYRLYIYIFFIIIFLILDFYYNCRFNARSYFERALVLLDDNVGK